jgi:hypothetical protein
MLWRNNSSAERYETDAGENTCFPSWAMDSIACKPGLTSRERYMLFRVQLSSRDQVQVSCIWTRIWKCKLSVSQISMLPNHI